VDGAGAGDGLEGGDALLGQGGGVGAQHHFRGGGGEVGEAGDGQVFVVELGVVLQDLICLLSLCQPLSCNTPPCPLCNPSLTPNYLRSLDNPSVLVSWE
jgi:hypothetical protein